MILYFSILISSQCFFTVWLKRFIYLLLLFIKILNKEVKCSEIYTKKYTVIFTFTHYINLIK